MTSAADRPLLIAMVAGEASGDNLGAPLVREILQQRPDARFLGIGGPAMIAEGFESLVEMEQLSVNGIIDPLKRLPQLIRILRRVRDSVVASGADCFVGIDYNFFNLLLEGLLKKQGVRTVHYVSPTVWAWRKGRIKKIKRNVDLMMTLYPFENAIYEEHGIPVAFVGHPRALDISATEGIDGRLSARSGLGIGEAETVVAILPGSRSTEVRLTGRDFLETALLLKGEVDRFLVPAANPKRAVQIREMLADYPLLRDRVMVLDGQSREAMTAADAVLVNSGTATLEAMLLRKPMVMSYRLGSLTYSIVSRMIRAKRFALPNILADRDLVPEFIQDEAVPARMAEALRQQLVPAERQALMSSFDAIHQTLKKNDRPGVEAAHTVIEFCSGRLPHVPS